MSDSSIPKLPRGFQASLERLKLHIDIAGQRRALASGTTDAARTEQSPPRKGPWVTLDLKRDLRRLFSDGSLPPPPPLRQPGRDELPDDGMLLGQGGKTMSADVPLTFMPAVEAPGADPNAETVIQVNGIRTSLDQQLDRLPEVAKITGMRAIGLHNATGGALSDIAQAIGDKLGCSANPASTALAYAMYNELRQGKRVHIMAHSQGALVTAGAIDVLKRWIGERANRSPQETEQILSHVEIETFGGACATFPDGPQYVHYVNDNDSVPKLGCLAPNASLGKGARVVRFSAGSGLEAHAFETYLKFRKPFEQS